MLNLGSITPAAIHLGSQPLSRILLGAQELWSAAFNPLDLAPALWLDASDTSTLYDAVLGGSFALPEGAVGRWDDKSGNSNLVYQNIGTARPIHKAAIQNGLSALNFDGNEDRFAHSMDVDVATIIASYQLRSLQGSFRGLYAAGSTTAPDGVMFLSHTNINNKWGSWGGSPISADSDRVTAPVIHAMTTDGGNTVAFRKDGVPDGVRPGNPYGHGTRHVGGHTGQYTQMYLFELLVFDRVLTAPEIAALESYLSEKWGIPLL